MAVLNYYSVGGQIVGEKPSGGNRRDYLTDALGSVVGTVTSTGAVENTYRYKPYGGLLARTGVASDPSFLWVGSQGYRQTGKKYSDVYVRARHYSSDVGRWTTRDPIGYDDGWNQYGYVQGNPILLGDPSGMQAPGQCYGVCGRIADRWLSEEFSSQIGGWDKYVAKNGLPPISSTWTRSGYLEWANGNQRYKVKPFVFTPKPSNCGTDTSPPAPRGCGISITICNICVFSGNMGNIMYGFMGAYAGYHADDLVRVAEDRKKKGASLFLGKFDPLDKFAYRLGFESFLCAGGQNIVKFKYVPYKRWCDCFNKLLRKYPQALQETNIDTNPPSFNDSRTCGQCKEVTQLQVHGGSQDPRYYP